MNESHKSNNAGAKLRAAMLALRERDEDRARTEASNRFMAQAITRPRRPNGRRDPSGWTAS